ncbi:MAG TPA: ABC transporter permease [Candidatus Acidoferrales bacterium]|nr:ABC transporter permease [Candidatus Acidoferrales bacterium]
MISVVKDFASDFSYGVRQMRRNLSLTILCAGVLAIGIGSATAVFAVLYDALLRPLPYRDASQIVVVHNDFASVLGRAGISAPDYVDLSAHREIFSETAAYYFNDFTMTGVSGSAYVEHVDAVNASASLFSLLGIRPQLGRTILPTDDHGAAGVLVLSDAFWKSKFGGNPGVIGKSIVLDGKPYQIIGIMPADFNFPYPATQMWVPLALRPEAFAPDERGNKWLHMLARPAPGITPERANAMLASVSRQMAKLYPDDYPENAGWHFSAEQMQAEQTKDVRQWLLLALGAVACILFIACINVSGLLLVRATVRNREWAVRSALGASSGRLVRQLLTETGLLVALGCGAGMAVATALVQLINTYGPLHNTQVEPRMLAFALAVCVISTLLSGLLPAILTSRASIDPTLRAGAGRTITGHSRWRGVLVAGQISVAVALLFTATALGRSFAKLLALSPGFSPEHVWSGSVGLPQKGYTTRASRAEFFRDLVERIAALPQVKSASAATALPFSSGGYTADLFIPAHPATSARPAARVNIVLPNYFGTMKIPLVKGRTFTAQDDESSQAVVMIDEEFAREYFADEDPIGKLVANNCCHDRLATVIGVVGNVTTRELGASPRPEIYWPELQLANSAMFLTVREAGNTDVTSAAREILRGKDSAIALFDVETMPQRIMDSVKLRQFLEWLLNAFALVGMILAALGLYGTLAYVVQLRRREMAIRMAFGARPRDVARLVARYSFFLAMAGVLPGIVLCVLSMEGARRFLFGISPLDPVTAAYTAAGLLVIVAIATLSPVAQVAGLDPLAMLREE